MTVEYRRGDTMMRGEIVPQFCERTDKYHNTMRYGEFGLDQLIQPVVGGFTPNSPGEASGLKVRALLPESDGKRGDQFSGGPGRVGNRAGHPSTGKDGRGGR